MMENHNQNNCIVAKSIHHYLFNKIDKNALYCENLIYLPEKGYVIICRRFVGKRVSYCDSLEDVLKIETFKQQLGKEEKKLIVLNQFENNLEPLWDDETNSKISYGELNKYNIFYVLSMIVSEIYQEVYDIPPDFSLLIGDTPDNKKNNRI